VQDCSLRHWEVIGFDSVKEFRHLGAANFGVWSGFQRSCSDATHRFFLTRETALTKIRVLLVSSTSPNCRVCIPENNRENISVVCRTRIKI